MSQSVISHLIMVFQLMKLNIEVSDESFNEIYPESIRKHAKRHWTPVAVAKLAAEFLAEKPNSRILDIGSGAGKFCMIGGAITNATFTGVEYRKNLFEYCVKMARAHRLDNVHYIHANITSIDFNAYDGFYFFNSFRENIDQTALIDQSVETGEEQMKRYTDYTYRQLAQCRVGTRLVTYWVPVTDIPSNYAIAGTAFGGMLNLFEKVK